jgi:hypothetical protein
MTRMADESSFARKEGSERTLLLASDDTIFLYNLDKAHDFIYDLILFKYKISLN